MISREIGSCSKKDNKSEISIEVRLSVLISETFRLIVKIAGKSCAVLLNKSPKCSTLVSPPLICVKGPFMP